jgi:hypothetical protein
MQTTYRLNANEIDYSFFEAFQKLFKNKEISIKIEEINPPVNQREILKKIKATNKKYPPRVISSDINIHEILKEINL